jgi:hypothetical protein
MSSMALALEYLGLRYTLIPYMQNQHNISPSNLIDYIYINFIKHPKNFRHDFLEREFDKVYTSQYNCAHGITINNHIDTHVDFPLILSVPNYIGFIVLQSINEFLNPICNDLAKKFNDEKIIDLGEYISNSLIDVRYDPTIGREFDSSHNWFEYFSRGVALNSTKVRYKVADTEVYLNTKRQPISWHLYQDNLAQYAFQQVLEITNKTSKTIAQV